MFHNSIQTENVCILVHKSFQISYLRHVSLSNNSLLVLMGGEGVKRFVHVLCFSDKEICFKKLHKDKIEI